MLKVKDQTVDPSNIISITMPYIEPSGLKTLSSNNIALSLIDFALSSMLPFSKVVKFFCELNVFSLAVMKLPALKEIFIHNSQKGGYPKILEIPERVFHEKFSPAAWSVVMTPHGTTELNGPPVVQSSSGETSPCDGMRRRGIDGVAPERHHTSSAFPTLVPAVGVTRGKRRVKRVPSPGMLCTVMVPRSVPVTRL